MYYYRQPRCDGCNRILKNNSNITALIPNIIVRTTKIKGYTKLLKLELKEESFDLQQMKIYCSTCLSIQNYLEKEKK